MQKQHTKSKSGIEWCDYTWNPVTGCLHGCGYCYAEKIARRFGTLEKNDTEMEETINEMTTKEYGVIVELKERLHREPYPYDFVPTLHRYRLEEPQHVKKPSKIFVTSMGDLFGEWVPDEWIREVLAACEKAPWHTYLFLTKNAGRYMDINSWDHRYSYTFAKEYMWFGATVTDQKNISRIRMLPGGANSNTFLSIEPILGPIDMSFRIPKQDTRWQCSYCGYFSSKYSPYCAHCGHHGGYSGSFRRHPINWVIIGAMTGPGAKQHQPKREWVEDIVAQCKEAGVPVFMKRSLSEIWGEPLIQEWPEGMR